MDANETEKRAAELVYERDHGLKVSFLEIPEEEKARILKEIRARAMRIEQFVTHDMLVEKIGEARRTPRRHMVAAIVSGFMMLVLVLVALGLAKLVGIH